MPHYFRKITQNLTSGAYDHLFVCPDDTEDPALVQRIKKPRQRSSQQRHGPLPKFGYPPGVEELPSLMRHRCMVYIHGARERDLLFSLTGPQFAQLTSGNCHYCGSAPSTRHKCSGISGEWIYNGIDRMDPKQGYEMGNCVSCCWTCNHMKSDLSYDEFIGIISRIWHHRGVNPKQH